MASSRKRTGTDAELDEPEQKCREIDVRPLPPSTLARRPQLYSYAQKSLEWLAARTEQTASPAAANCGLSPYRNAHPVFRWLVMTGRVVDDFKGNEHTEYGERYEPRVRAIAAAVFGVDIAEWGMFRSWARRHLAVSPDGETSSTEWRGRHEDGRPFRWTLGKMMVEIKCSKDHQYETPKLPHITQLQLQLEVMGRAWGILHYWSRDVTRAWLMRHDHYGFARWMMRRLDLMHEHVVRNVEVTVTNPYFAYLLPEGQCVGRFGRTVADWLDRDWFDWNCHEVNTIPGRRPITMDQWRAELALLGMSEKEWAEKWPDTVAHAGDAGQLVVPPRPEIYQVYAYRRVVPPEEEEFASPKTVKDHDPADGEWFRRAFPPVTAGEDVVNPPHDDPYVRMPRLFVDEVIDAPAHDESPPQDQTADESPEERAVFERRLADLCAKADAPRLAEEARLAALAAQRARDEADRARQAERAAERPFTRVPAISASLWDD